MSVTNDPPLWAFIREQMRMRDMSQNEFARAMGLSSATFTAMRHGHTPGVDIIRQLADRLDVPFNRLMETAGIVSLAPDPLGDVPLEVRAVLQRYERLSAEQKLALVRLFEQMISFAETQNRSVPGANGSEG